MAFWLTQYFRSLPPNFGKVSPTVYRSADPNKRLDGWIKQYKLEVVLDLRDERDAEEEARVNALGLIYTRLAMRDDEAPTPALVREALKVMSSGIVTLVHCEGGRHRTGLIVACYQVMNGATKQDAWKNAKRYGWYDTWGHKPLRLWFENEFKPEDYR